MRFLRPFIPALIPALFLVGAFLASTCWKVYLFDVGCEGHLKRAADANTVELALSELDTALTYAEQKGLTSGSTAVIFPTPAEDLGFWYKNLSASRDELRKLGPDAPLLTKTNMLMKLRETLLDKTQSGESVTAPGNISLFPNQRIYAAWGVVVFLLLILSVILTLRAWVAQPYTFIKLDFPKRPRD